MTVLIAVDRGHLTSTERDTVLTAYRIAAERARQLNPSVAGPPTSLELQAEFRRMGHHVEPRHVRGLAVLAGLVLADR